MNSPSISRSLRLRLSAIVASTTAITNCFLLCCCFRRRRRHRRTCCARLRGATSARAIDATRSAAGAQSSGWIHLRARSNARLRHLQHSSVGDVDYAHMLMSWSAGELGLAKSQPAQTRSDLDALLTAIGSYWRPKDWIRSDTIQSDPNRSDLIQTELKRPDRAAIARSLRDRHS